MSEQEASTAQTTPQTQRRPEFVNGVRVRMPEDYDFNTWGKDYSSYEKDFKLRTDAVWEKQQLKDWFRLAYKVFFFNKKEKKFQFIEPDDLYTMVIEPESIEDNQVMDWPGMTQTGVTNAFQVGLGAKEPVKNTFNTYYSMPDYYMMCALRFQKWFRCDTIYGDFRSTRYDRNPEKGLKNMKPEDEYPCFRDWLQTTYACADNVLKLMIELAYRKRAEDFVWENHASIELRTIPVKYDSPLGPDRVTYTY